ncbi:glycosyltransferase family 2 protein [Alicyclobacillus mali]|uniref:Glycosyltransferase family 2 protein n=2 Tax=Alicyclobacillus mali (ex Roth et al. 2021) TaxID=1123961 RepID=A0ABS0F406_9BACL|nr:glycosyltransferase family 2 protein [Alicyclobacillus mali (ex Roth et al. 2021)]MCL6489965.1 glycosyltransferase family 2 protein [Alicyclobacillus mali (ex Roth et al. 2021)]
MRMATWSLCMIVRNEEDTLPRCLASVGDLADEIIVVDTGSTDRTSEVARSFGAHVHPFTWRDDFSAARNYAFSLATADYILWLDADDVIRAEDLSTWKALKASLDPGVDAVTAWYHLAFYGDEPSYSSRLVRLVRRTAGFLWRGQVHEYLEVRGNVLHADAAVCHRPVRRDADRNLRIYEARIRAGELLGPRDTLYYANELVDHGRIVEAMPQYEAFLKMPDIWKEDAIFACYRLADCHLRLGQQEEARMAVLRSFLYDAPRSEACCRLGHAALEQGDLEAALSWYRLAILCRRPPGFLGFLNRACETWLPHIQLCVILARLGRIREAYEQNEWAAKFLGSEDPMILHNRTQLAAMLQASEGA